MMSNLYQVCSWIGSFFAGLALFFLSGVSYAEAIQIELRQKSTVSDSRIYLGDVAKCTGPGQRCREVSGIDLGASPQGGKNLSLSKTLIENVLSVEWPDEQTEIQGPDYIRVEGASKEVSLVEINKHLQDYLNQRFAKLPYGMRVQVAKTQIFGTTVVRPTQNRISFPDLEALPLENMVWVTRNFNGSRMTQVRYQNSKDPEDLVHVQIHVTYQVERWLPTPKQGIPAGQMITSNHLEFGWVILKKNDHDVASLSENLVGKKTRLGLEPGEAISLRVLEQPVAVERNRPVTMIIRRGDLEITSKATVLDPGKIGQTVDVINVATKKRMRARVVDDKTVEAISF